MRCLTYLSCFCIFALIAISANSADSLHWSGFLRTGVAIGDSKYSYDKDIDNEANFMRPSYLGLNLESKLQNNLIVHSQFIARGKNGEARVTADWFYVEQNISKLLTINIGRQHLPLTLIAEHKDWGHAYPWTEAPREFYQLFPLKSFDGLSFEFKEKIGALNFVQNLFIGTSFFSNEDSISNSGQNTQQMTAYAKQLAGAKLSLEHENFKLFASFARAKLNFNNLPLHDRLISATNFGFHVKSSDFGFWTELISTKDHHRNEANQQAKILYSENEKTQVRVEELEKNDINNNNIPNLKNSVINTRNNAVILEKELGGYKAWYATVSYSPISKFVLHYTKAQSEVGDIPLYHGNQSSDTFGLNFEINSKAQIKFSYSVISIKEKTNGLFKNKDQETSSSAKSPADDHSFAGSNVMLLYYNLTF